MTRHICLNHFSWPQSLTSSPESHIYYKSNSPSCLMGSFDSNLQPFAMAASDVVLSLTCGWEKMNKAVKHPIDCVIETYPDCPSYMEFPPFYFFSGFWVRMERGTMPTKCNSAYGLSAQPSPIPPRLCEESNSQQNSLKSPGLHPSSVKWWCLWLWGPNSFLAFVFLLGVGGRSLARNPSGSHRD